MRIKRLTNLIGVLGIALTLSSCSLVVNHPEHIEKVKVIKSEAKDIVSFSIGDRVGLIRGTDIAVTMPYGTLDLTNLTPTITISVKAVVNPASEETLDFTGPIIYTVTAEDGTTNDYTVTVTAATVPDVKEITSFSILGNSGVITGKNIEVGVPPYGSDTPILRPIIKHTGVSISPESEEPQIFTGPVIYTVTAEDGSTEEYTVTVTPRTSCILRETGFAGGIIFYDKGYFSEGWRCLEATPSNQGAKEWSNITSGAVGTGTGIGSGQTNTTAIMGQAGHTDSAAKLCSDLLEGGYEDWFLPSMDELNQMYLNLVAYYDPHGFLTHGFISTYYWTSSEYSSHARAQNMEAGWQGIQTRSTGYNVRCIRSF